MLQIEHNINQFQRFNTKPVKIGKIYLGGQYPVRLQSMTDRDTNDIEASLSQCIRMIHAGAEMVRLTTQGTREVESIGKIKARLVELGYAVPVIADVHFNPKAAEQAAKYVDKVRINPGNYIDKRAKFEKVEFSDEEYRQETERIRQRLLPLIEICKKHKTALRVGVNHGSLSDRMMSKYGNTPEGMVESAMEFIRIFHTEDFHDIVISMKASNTRVMIHANRLLVEKMKNEEMNYPVHLGVTEAGVGEDGRIKSAIGIGSLLADGIGDTIRVSLTEKPENEMPAAKIIINHIHQHYHQPIHAKKHSIQFHPFHFKKHLSKPLNFIGGNNAPVVIADFPNSNEFLADESLLGMMHHEEEGIMAGKELTGEEQTSMHGNAGGWSHEDRPDPESIRQRIHSFHAALNEKGLTPDIFYIDNPRIIGYLPDHYCYITDFRNWQPGQQFVYPVFTLSEYLMSEEDSDKLNFIIITLDDIDNGLIEEIKNCDNIVLVFKSKSNSVYREFRYLMNYLILQEIDYPVIPYSRYQEPDTEKFQITSAIDNGSLFVDGFGDGIWISNPDAFDLHTILNTSFSILQASRARITKTEFISCPGCGRTLFNLQETAARIREKTGHLKGLKIGIMGCIVNGPGEMADADYGYVGAGPGKISLYKNKELVRQNIPEEEAVDELVKLIKAHGDWLES